MLNKNQILFDKKKCPLERKCNPVIINLQLELSENKQP